MPEASLHSAEGYFSTDRLIIVILQSSTSVIMVPNASIKVNGSVSSLLPVWHGLFLMSLFGIHLKM